MHNFLMNKFNVYHNADTGSGGGGTDGGSEGGSEGGTDEGGDGGTGDIMIPKSRFDEVNNGYKSLKAEMDALRATQTQAETEAQAKAQKEAEAKGEFENLYNGEKAKAEAVTGELTGTKARVEALEATINTLLETKLETIDKSFHDLIPNLTPEAKLAWITTAEQKGLFGTTSKANEALGGNTNPKNNSGQVDIDQLSPIQLMMSGYENN